MRQFSFACLALTVVAQLALVAAPASAEEAGAIAQLPAQKVSTDVRSACPNIDQALQASLAHVVRLAPTSGMVGVEFKLDGERVSSVHLNGNNNFSDFGRTVRWAVGDLGCTAHGSTQSFAFTLHFNDADGVPAEQRVALLP